MEENIKASFKQLVSELVSKKLEQYEELYIQREKDRFILPLRPIVMSGDDITFVCEGRLGIYLAKKWVEILINKPVLGKKVSYCAGVCVANTNFPFQRAYKLAEEACKNAKIKVRDLQRKDENIIKEELNWIDFHIQYGGYGGELVELRKQFFAMGGNLIARPYQIGGNESNSLHTLIEDTTVLKEYPTSIQHELREVLWKNQSDRNNYLQFNKTRKSSIDFEHFKFNKKYDPNSLFKNDSADNIDENNDNKTHFFDMIELAEFYPWFLESGK